MIYGGPGFLAVVRYGSSPYLVISRLSLFLSLPVCRRSSLLTEEGVGEEPIHTTARNPGPPEIIQYFLASTFTLFWMTTESVFVKLLRAQESTPGVPVRQPYVTYRRASLHRLAESIPGAEPEF